jgi:hypothetical protein
VLAGFRKVEAPGRICCHEAGGGAGRRDWEDREVCWESYTWSRKNWTVSGSSGSSSDWTRTLDESKSGFEAIICTDT